jgi:hypothetical protein
LLRDVTMRDMVRSDRCGLFVAYGTGEADHGRLELGSGWPRRWTTTWRAPCGDVACAVRDLGSVPVAGRKPVRRFAWRGLWYGKPDPTLKPYQGKPSSQGGRHKGEWVVRGDRRDQRAVFFQDPADPAEWAVLPWNGLPPEGEVPAFSDKTARELLREARAEVRTRPCRARGIMTDRIPASSACGWDWSAEWDTLALLERLADLPTDLDFREELGAQLHRGHTSRGQRPGDSDKLVILAARELGH